MVGYGVYYDVRSGKWSRRRGSGGGLDPGIPSDEDWIIYDGGEEV